MKISELVKIMNEYALGFKDEWNQEDGLYNEGDDTSIHSLFSFYSHYVAERLDHPTSINKKELFDYIETIMDSSDGNLKDAAATCFLENFLFVAGDKFRSENYFRFLGAKSIDFCRALDNFHGVKTEGLW